MLRGNIRGNNLQNSRGVAARIQIQKRAMALTLRPTGLSSPAFQDWADYIVRDDGRDVGRLYEDRNSLPALRWFWSITVYVNPKLGITTSGRAPSLNEAKAQFLTSWQKCRADSTPCPARLYLARPNVQVAFGYPAGGVHRAVPAYISAAAAVRAGMVDRDQA
jgi:hypothetical protein